MEGITKILTFLVIVSSVRSSVAPISKKIIDDGKEMGSAAQVSKSTTEPNSLMDKIAYLLEEKSLKSNPHGEHKAVEKGEIVYGGNCPLIGNCHLDFALIVIMVVGFALCAFKIGYELVEVLYEKRDAKTRIIQDEWTPVYFARNNSPRNHGV